MPSTTTTPSSAPKVPSVVFVDFDGTCTGQSGQALWKAAGSDVTQSAKALFKYTENEIEQEGSTIANHFRPGVAESLLNYFEYLGSETYDATNPTLEIVIVTNNYNLYVYKILELLVSKSVQKKEIYSRGLEKFKSKIQSTNRHYFHDDQKRRYRTKSNIIASHMASLGRTASPESCFFYDDSEGERNDLLISGINITIGDENAFLAQLATMNALIQAGRAGTTPTNQTALYPDSDSKDGIENMTTGVNRTAPSETTQLVPNNQRITSSPSSSSTCAAFFKKRETELIALGMFGSFSSLGILAYLQYHGPDGKSFLDGLKDIPNNPSTLGLAIVGGVFIALLIATAVAACRSGSQTGYTPLPQ